MSIIFLLLFLLCCNTPVLSTKNSDESALLKIKKQLGDPPFLSSWVKGFNFCDAAFRTSSVPDETSVSGRVPHFYNNSNLDVIVLARNNLSHSIPPSLSTLPILTYLNLSSNHLTGTIPKSLVNVWGIDVGNNQLHGDASFLFGNQSKVGVIILANNSFKFDLSYVEFTDNLYEVDISHNKIYGKVPSSFATAFGLAYANLSFNRLCGELPQGGIMGRFSAAVFANNRCLCGYPLPPCSNSSPAPAPALPPA
ncbi:hypothetical protein LUZ63_004211 [Rhynchospora breviuscula]|uniref:Leucine-rich repeat-containing N-terminal plant-type domain-containing protein n=1 Tax=Rhynchospora breviuscula TaxID=2022672 RepID=A0A9Q0D243_9POAL|nr:hypothetical protein LUZ63_004211 [Rhynchospora breviuscula]